MPKVGRTQKSSNKITASEKRLIELLSRNSTLEIEVAYDKCGVEMHLKALIDVDDKDMFTVIHEIWNNDVCMIARANRFRYVEDQSTGKAAEFYDSNELKSKIKSSAA
jgi:hypothetical protein